MLNTQPWIAGLGVALVAGAAGGAVGRYAAPAPKVSTPSVTVSPERPVAGSEGLAQRIADLERQVARLGLQTAARHLEPTPAASEGRPRPEAAAPTVDDPVFEAAVRDVMERLEEERRTERQSRSDERRREAVERWSTGLGKKLQLTEEQRQKALAIMTEFSTALRAARNSDGEPLTRDEWRQKTAALREKSEAQLSQVLSPSQRQKYDALEESEKLGSAAAFRRR